MRGDCHRVQSFFLGPDENVLKLLVLMVTQIREHTKDHLVVYFKWMEFMVCKADLNKSVI